MIEIQTGKEILCSLAECGYQAYIVGGSLRNAMLGLEPRDVDIITNAPVSKVMEIASKKDWKAIGVGAAFGVIALIVDGKQYDVAAAHYGIAESAPRLDNDPSWILGDLSRRDFTMNAMAMGSNEVLIDPFGGIDDIQQKIIRTVGNPADRYREDGLRMFRVARFAAQYGFTVEEGTRLSIAECIKRVKGVSVERIVNELEKVLVAPYVKQGLILLVESGLLSQECRARDNKTDNYIPILPELVRLAGVSQNPCFHYFDVLEHTLEAVSHSPANPILRWAALLHDIAKGLPNVRRINRQGEPSDYGHDKVGAELAEMIIKRLKLPLATLQRVVWLIAHHSDLPAPESSAVLRWLRRLSQSFKTIDELQEASGQLLDLYRADQLAGHVNPSMDILIRREAITREIVNTVPFYPAQLQISGHKIAQALGEGPIVAAFQQDLLTRIQSGRLNNDDTILGNALAAKRTRLARAEL